MNNKTFLLIFLALSMAVIFSGVAAAANTPVANVTPTATVVPEKVNQLTNQATPLATDQMQTNVSTKVNQPDRYRL
jgi:hypothetical protein